MKNYIQPLLVLFVISARKGRGFLWCLFL